ncbi:ABC transporter permease subunit, partial [Rhizobium johnstonii]|uniref:ABC transporter permease subunit n=1 Tax=Rhizobium johnstonii TaxID=3019933 RepID=UPI003F9E26B3
RHIVPNALIPIRTMIVRQFTLLVAGAVLVENFFNLPGLGRLALQALSQRDIIFMQYVVLFFAGLVIVRIGISAFGTIWRHSTALRDSPLA